jgi:hypothetical protein
MKKIVTIMLIMLSVTTLTAKDPYHFIVQGSFIADKNIKYTIFKMEKNGALVAIEHVKGRKYYFVECNVGDKYVVRFQNKKGNVKFLMIDASANGYFQADLDWTQPYDGWIKREKAKYKLTRICNAAKDPVQTNI